MSEVLIDSYRFVAPEGSAIFGTFAYLFGGATGTASNSAIQEIENGTSATSIVKANLGVPTSRCANAQNETVIITMGGNSGGGVSNLKDEIQEYTISSASNSITKGVITDPTSQVISKGFSTTHAYMLGGNETSNGDYQTTIQEYEFETTSDATDKSNLSIATGNNGGWTNFTYSWSVGGGAPYGSVNIDRYENGTGTTAVSVADISLARAILGTPFNETLGIGMGGYYIPTDNFVARVDEYTLESEVNSTSKGDILDSACMSPGSSQTETHGYIYGGSGNLTGTQQYEWGTETVTADGTLLTATNNSGSGGCGTP